MGNNKEKQNKTRMQVNIKKFCGTNGHLKNKNNSKNYKRKTARFDFIQAKSGTIQDKNTINKDKPTWKECVQIFLQAAFGLHIIR